MKRLFILLTLLAFSIIGFYAYKQYYKTHEDLSDVRADYKISAVDLFEAFSDNEPEANTLYIGKVIEVSGIISNMTTEDTSIKIFLQTDDMLGEVQCEMDSAKDISSLQKGGEVFIRGVCSGYLTDVVMNRCVLIN